jgi:S1-C subfamily serine protease
MRNFIVGALMFFAGAGCAHIENKPHYSANDLIRKTALITVLYIDPKSPDNHNYGGLCSGVWVGDNHIITAFHCAWDERTFTSTEDSTKSVNTFISAIKYDTPEHFSNSGFMGTLTRVVYSQECDLLVLKTNGAPPQHPVAKFRLSHLEPGEAVQTVGHPGDLAWVYTKGYMAVTDNQFMSDVGYNIVNINIGHGNSGGGLFDERNYLVGITKAIVETGDTRLSMFTNQECLYNVLNAAFDSEMKNKQAW